MPRSIVAPPYSDPYSLNWSNLTKTINRKISRAFCVRRLVLEGGPLGSPPQNAPSVIGLCDSGNHWKFKQKICAPQIARLPRWSHFRFSVRQCKSTEDDPRLANYLALNCIVWRSGFCCRKCMASEFCNLFSQGVHQCTMSVLGTRNYAASTSMVS